VQAGGVGMMMFGMADETLVGGAEDLEQAARVNERKRKEKSLRMLKPGVDSHFVKDPHSKAMELSDCHDWFI
jgi:hypothetical protein